MTWDLNVRRWSRALNRKYIFDRLPLVHTLILFVEMLLVSRLTSRFNAYYNDRPVLTMMVTNAILGGVADTVAQTITATQQRAQYMPISLAPNGPNGKTGNLDLKANNGGMTMELPSFRHGDAHPDTKAAPPAPSFDLERLTRFMAYPFLMAPLQFRWFSLLERLFPIAKGNAFVPAMKRVAFDQIIFAPFGIACFFTALTIAEGAGRRAVVQKLSDMFVPTLKANYMVWPAVQIINFRLMPVQFQLPFVSTIGIAWTAYLSLTNASDEELPTHRPSPPASPRIGL